MTGLDWLTAALLVGGGFFCFIAALGVVRMQDVYIRMHASTKAGTLGVGMIAAAVALTGSGETVAKEIGIILFLLFTAPIGAHVIARAAFQSGVPLWAAKPGDLDRDNYPCENDVPPR